MTDASSPAASTAPQTPTTLEGMAALLPRELAGATIDQCVARIRCEQYASWINAEANAGPGFEARTTRERAFEAGVKATLGLFIRAGWDVGQPFFAALSRSAAVAHGVPAEVVEADRYPLSASVWKRSPYPGCEDGEWVLEIEGAINDTYLTSRHTEPLSTLPEDVPGLPTLYAQVPDDAALAPDAQAGAVGPDLLDDFDCARYAVAQTVLASRGRSADDVTSFRVGHLRALDAELARPTAPDARAGAVGPTEHGTFVPRQLWLDWERLIAMIGDGQFDESTTISPSTISRVVQAMSKVAVRDAASGAAPASGLPGVEALRLCGYCSTWQREPCGKDCCLQTTDPTWDQECARLSAAGTGDAGRLRPGLHPRRSPAMKPPVDAEARGVVITDNEVRAAGVCLTSFGKSVFPDQVRAALEAAAQVRVACPNTCAADRDRLATALAASQARVEELTEALHDAIVRPCGVVPESAQAFYSPASAIRAEARRQPFGSSQDRQERHYAEARALSPEPRT